MAEGSYNFPEPSGPSKSVSNQKSFGTTVKDTIKGLQNVFNGVSGYQLEIEGDPWPQTLTTNDFKDSDELRKLYPSWKSVGFLPPILCSPRAKTVKDPDDKTKTQLEVKKVGDVIYQDWRGHIIGRQTGVDNVVSNYKVVETAEKFNISLPDDLPRKTRQDLVDKPYSTRDLLSIFGDYSTDYFKHGLQIVDNLGTIPTNLSDFYRSGQSTGFRDTTFKHTPFENSDPIIYAFEIIIDDINSPLLNGSILDFLSLLSNVSEINARKKVYEEFKYHFTKFFKTKATVRYDESQLSITKSRPYGLPESEKNQKISEAGKKAYKSYYIQKIAGLAKLIETNTPSEKNFFAEYNKDVITLDFHESVSMSVGTLAHLYKLLYWSKPNGKTMVPENLLRFNCEIIISEMRNFARVRKNIETGNFETIKDNLSRYIYSLRECQFYFDKMPHDDQIDMTQPKEFEHVQVQFDYKYSTMKFERFVPDGDTGKGKYVGYDSGALWKIGNPGERENRGTQSGGTIRDSSIPKFYTEGVNRYNQTGVNEAFVLKLPNIRMGDSKDPSIVLPPKSSKDVFDESFGPESGDVKEGDTPDGQQKEGLKNFKEKSKKLAKEGADRISDAAIASAKSEYRRIKGQARATLRGLFSKISGVNGINPPRNIYTEVGVGPFSFGANSGPGRIFYDVRGEIINFAGDAFKDLLS